MSKLDTEWQNPDEADAKDRIEDGGWAACWICRSEYTRLRLTRRYCHNCRQGFCQGEHGAFQPSKTKSRAMCVVCKLRHEVPS